MRFMVRESNVRLDWVIGKADNRDGGTNKYQNDRGKSVS